ncbi:MAG TPA: alpha/beta hydrolase, partial [Bacillota bacterium]|nr:alpha/beta hydrolase [Bacillota bacterium]
MPEVVYGEETLKTQDGIELFCRTWLPSGPDGPRALVVICHGQAEHSGRYTHVAQFFAERGYAVYAYDLRGQGKSGG